MGYFTITNWDGYQAGATLNQNFVIRYGSGVTSAIKRSKVEEL